MAYQLISSITSPVTFLQSLQTFLSGAGWTIERSGALNGNLYELLVSTSYNSGIGAETFQFSLKVNATNDRTWIFLSGRTAYSSGSTIEAQTGFAGGPVCSVRSGGMTRAWLFATNQELHVFIEVQPGYFSRFSMGCLDRAFAPVSGEKTGMFVCGGVETSSAHWDNLTPSQAPDTRDVVLWGLDSSSFYKPGMRVRTKTVVGAQWTQDAANPRWFTNAAHQISNNPNFAPNNSQSPLSPIVQRLRADGSRPLMPVLVYSEHNPSQSIQRFLLGSLPDLRVLYYHGLAAGTEFTIGGDTWVAFPTPGHNRALTPIYFNQEWGWAVKKVV